jgi:hypothetical protein
MAMGVKKWFMLQMWRLQQVAQPLTLALLAINLSLTIFGLIKWREDSLLSYSLIGVPMILLVLAMIIWTFAIIWDIRLKMWRDQATVLVERNPYSKEKMSSKEVVLYSMFYLSVLDSLAKDDPVKREELDTFRKWIKKSMEMDPNTAKDAREILQFIGKGNLDVFLDKK